MGGPQIRSGCGGEEKNSQPLAELEPPIIEPVAQCYTTELSWLPKKDSRETKSIIILRNIFSSLALLIRKRNPMADRTV
jgi:hypothetical protein